MPENVTGFQPTGNLKKSLIDLAYFDMFPRRSPTFFREEPISLECFGQRLSSSGPQRAGGDGRWSAPAIF
jgi:hypothetical protein